MFRFVIGRLELGESVVYGNGFLRGWNSMDCWIVESIDLMDIWDYKFGACSEFYLESRSFEEDSRA